MSSNYKNILKTTSVIGGASFINILISMVRMKFVAVLLGPSGVGLVGMYTTITGLVGTVAGMGISTSGVRQIAKAFSEDDDQVVARTVKTLRRMVWFTGTLGCLGLILAASPLSIFSFNSDREMFSLALLGVTILLGSVATGQGCLLQGTRRIKELAYVSILGALNGTVISIPCYYIWGQQGIVPSLILSSVAGVITSWWFSRNIKTKSIKLSWRDSAGEAGQLLRFGFPIMLTGLLSAASAYLIRIVLIRQVGLDGVGIYQAAFALSSVLVNFVLGAMGSDYYPRLTAVATDADLVRREINTQTEVALLLATPGLAATLVFAPLVITLFYSGEFEGAVDILRWAIFGIFGRVVSWPLGYLLLAKGRGTLYLVTETVANIFHLGLLWICTKYWGLPGTGIAFVWLYCIYTILIYGVCSRLNGKLWTLTNLLQILGLGSTLVLIGLSVTLIDSDIVRWVTSLSLFFVVSCYCLMRLSTQIGLSWQTLRARLSGKNS